MHHTVLLSRSLAIDRVVGLRTTARVARTKNRTNKNRAKKHAMCVHLPTEGRFPRHSALHIADKRFSATYPQNTLTQNETE